MTIQQAIKKYQKRIRTANKLQKQGLEEGDAPMISAAITEASTCREIIRDLKEIQKTIDDE